MEKIKITKAEFYRQATTQGLRLVAASGLTLETILEQIRLQSNVDRIETAKKNRILCTQKGNKIMRGTSSLTLDANDTVYRYGDFTLVYTFTKADNTCNFDSWNTVIYI